MSDDSLTPGEKQQLREELVAACGPPPTTFLADIRLPATSYPPEGLTPENAWLHVIQQIDADTQPVYATIVLGHHPPSAPLGLGLLGTDKHLRKLLKHTDAAAYLHGHLHMYFVNS